MYEVSKQLIKRGVAGFVRNVQQYEQYRAIKSRFERHQTAAGVTRVEREDNLFGRGTSVTGAKGKESTENQFNDEGGSSLEIRGDVARQFPGLFGLKKVNGRDISVEQTIAYLTGQTSKDFERVLSERAKLIDRVAKGEEKYGFLPEAKSIPDADGKELTVSEIRQGMIDNFLGVHSANAWKLNAEVPIPAEVTRPGLQGTGPADALDMAMGAVNTGAYGAVSWMWDWEDAGNDFEVKLYQAWEYLKELLAGVWDSKTYKNTQKKKDYKINIARDKWPVIFHRVPGLHLKSRQLSISGQPVPAMIPALVIHVLNNFDSLRARKSGVYFYVPKIETPEEALLVAKLLSTLEEIIGVPRGTIKIEMLNERSKYASNQEAIMWVLRHWLIGPNVGRWDYINSRIEMMKDSPDGIFPDPQTVTMSEASMTEYTRRNALLTLLVNGFPIGGMAAVMRNPKKPENDPKAIRSIFVDKLRERLTGLLEIDGKLFDSYRQSWVATVEQGYVEAGAEPLQASLLNLQGLVDSLTTPEKTAFIKIGLINEQGKITPYKITKDDLSADKLWGAQAFNNLFAVPKGQITLEGLRYAF
ncbi:MAG: hypothetical protein HZC17_07500, partial [Candidatus Omnitrophica bacterium]|nr:hypothetical protein [Candidatus Omnitrophota bacterium]